MTLWIIVRQAPLSIAFSRQEYWSELPFSSPGDGPNPGIKQGYKVLAHPLRHSMVILSPELPQHQRLSLGISQWYLAWLFLFLTTASFFSIMKMFPRALYKKYSACQILSLRLLSLLTEKLNLSRLYVQIHAYHSSKGICCNNHVLLKRQSNNRGIILYSIMIP